MGIGDGKDADGTAMNKAAYNATDANNVFTPTNRWTRSPPEKWDTPKGDATGNDQWEDEETDIQPARVDWDSRNDVRGRESGVGRDATCYS